MSDHRLRGTKLEAKRGMSRPDGELLLDAQGLRKAFGMTNALRGVDLTVDRGEILAIVGPSGSGKSTLLHLLAGVLTPDSGWVAYQGTVISDLPEARRSQLRLREFGFIFQFGQLLPDLSAIDNVMIPLLLSGLKGKAAFQRAHHWLDRLGLADEQARLPAEMSGGQAQRVAVARALATEPRVLFADEPTGSLDSLAAEKVMSALTDQARSTGTAVVLITHDARTAAYADREVVVRDGRISAAGNSAAATGTTRNGAVGFRADV
jgi:putative ABC transport system ATP-binding protein